MRRSRWAAAAMAAFLVSGVGVGSALAAPTRAAVGDNDFELPARAPEGITTGPDGNLWFAEPGRIGKISTAGTVTTYSLPVGAHPTGITSGPDGDLWFTNGKNGMAIGRITTSGVITMFTGPRSEFRDAFSIVAGPDGALWYTEYHGYALGRVTTSGAISKYTGDGGHPDHPYGLTVGPDGALWFTDAKVRHASASCAAGPDHGTTIGRMVLGVKRAQVTVFTNSSICGPRGIVSGPDGALWFANTNSNTIGRITTAGVVTTYSGRGIEHPLELAVGSDGALWFTNYGDGSIGRITTSGAVSNYRGAGIDGPDAITAGPDGALWFTNYGNGSIGRITTSGVVTNYPT